MTKNEQATLEELLALNLAALRIAEEEGLDLGALRLEEKVNRIRLRLTQIKGEMNDESLGNKSTDNESVEAPAQAV